MKPIVPPPPAGPYPLHYNPLPDHTQLPDREGGKPLRPCPGPSPDHTLLPDKDGTFVKNSYEYWQSHLLTDSVLPALSSMRPQGDYFIGEDCGIYWRLVDPPERGCTAPDWFLVPDVSRLLDGQMRRSYVMWQEAVPPLLVLEYVSGDGTEERDRTPLEGKFWVYEHAIRSIYYGIYEPNTGTLEMYAERENTYVRMQPNHAGRYPIGSLNVEIGTWKGSFGGYDISWLRWWDSLGNLLLTGQELAGQERQRAEQERQRAEQERQRAEQERQRADRLAERLRSLGVDPEKVE